MDEARSTAELDAELRLAALAEKRLAMLDDALARFDQSAYGICADCGEQIPTERLQVLPFALCCVDCQEKRSEVPGPARNGSVSFERLTD